MSISIISSISSQPKVSFGKSSKKSAAKSLTQSEDKFVPVATKVARSKFKNFLKAAVLSFGLGAGATTGLTSCDPKDDPIPPIVKEDPNANLTPLQRRFKNTMAIPFALDSTEAGAIQRVKFLDNYFGYVNEYILDEKASSKDTLKFFLQRYMGDEKASAYNVDFYVDSKDNILTSKTKRLDGTLTNIRKYTKIDGTVKEATLNSYGSYTIKPDTVKGQSIKYFTGDPEVSRVIKLLERTMKKM